MEHVSIVEAKRDFSKIVNKAALGKILAQVDRPAIPTYPRMREVRWRM